MFRIRTGHLRTPSGFPRSPASGVGARCIGVADIAPRSTGVRIVVVRGRAAGVGERELRQKRLRSAYWPAAPCARSFFGADEWTLGEPLFDIGPLIPDAAVGNLDFFWEFPRFCQPIEMDIGKGDLVLLFEEAPQHDGRRHGSPFDNARRCPIYASPVPGARSEISAGFFLTTGAGKKRVELGPSLLVCQEIGLAKQIEPCALFEALYLGKNIGFLDHVR